MKELCGSFTLSTGRNLQMNTPAGRLFGDTWFCVICPAASISRTRNHATASHSTYATASHSTYAIAEHGTYAIAEHGTGAIYAHDTDTIIAGELPHRLPGHTYYYNLNMSYHYPVAHSIMRVLALEHMN